MSVQPRVEEKHAMEIIPANEIDIRNAEQVQAIRAKLLDWSESNHAAFAAQTRAFMEACNVPAQEPGIKGGTTVASFINGVPLYSIADTTPMEYDILQGKPAVAQPCGMPCRSPVAKPSSASWPRK